MLAKKVQGAGGVGGAAGGGVAFVAAITSDSITSIDISDPSNLSILDTHVDNTVLDLVNTVRLDPVNEVLYALNKTSGVNNYFSSYDVSDPTNITLLDSLQPVSGGVWTEMAIDAVNQIAIVWGFESFVFTFRTIDISDPSNLSVLGTLNSTQGPYLSNTVTGWPAIDSSAGRALLPSDPDRIGMMDISTPSSPSEVTSLYDPTNLDRAVFIQLNTATEELFVTSYDDMALTSVDYSVSGGTLTVNSKFVMTPSVSGGLPQGLRLDLTNDIAYVAAVQADEIFAIDISNPASMSQLGSLYSTPYFNSARDLDIDVANSVLYGVGAYLGNGVFTSVDISNPASMSVIDSITSATMQSPFSVQIY
jgi:hypothetical protein